MLTVLCKGVLLAVLYCGCASCASLRDTGYELYGRILVVFTSSWRGLKSDNQEVDTRTIPHSKST